MLQGYIKKLLFVACLLVSTLVAAAPTSFFVEGQDYTKLPETTRNNPTVAQLLMSDPRKVQVLMFFNYGCHGCEMLHTPFDKWETQQKAKDNNKVAIYKIPVSFNYQWSMLARLYYVNESLDPMGRLNDTIFNEIHKKGLKLWNADVMKKFYIQHGFTAEQFDAAYNSFKVSRQLQKAEALTKAYGVITTPELIVNGPVNSYKLDVAKVGTNMQRLIDIINYLVAREQKLL